MDPVLLVVLIFVLRVLNYAIGTIRIVVTTRNQRLLASVLAGIEALIFAVVIAGVVSDLENIPNLTAYTLGAAVGTWVGMALESRLIRGYMIVNVFANREGQAITERLRDAGFGVTTNVGEGMSGEVLTLRSVIDKRSVKRFVGLVQEVNPEAFIAAEEVRGIQRGWLGVGRGGKRG